MKDFMKYTLATIVGLLLFSIVMTVVSIISLAGIAANESMSSPIEEKSILRINLQGTIEERSTEMPISLELLQGSNVSVIGLDDALIALEKAATNDNIVGIYMEGGPFSATPAMTEEFRNALLKFKESGKWIVAYGDSYSKSAYYLCSVADRIMLNPEGMLDWSGMASVPMFFKDVLEKIGVKMQVFKVGTYKSAVEPFTSTEMSDANREQVTSYLTSIWGNMLTDVSASRNIDIESLNAMADSLTMLAPAAVSLEGGLVDTLCYISDVKEYLKEKAEASADENLNFVSLNDVAKSETLQEKISEEIAVYYAYGDIVESATGGFSQSHQIASKEVVKDLQELRENEDIKAVVIRVNSGGGSAYASEQIWHEVELLKAQKPVVISMGGMAASGGYYISCSANEIFAEPTTLTGSIGIFGMVPDASELLTQKIGLKFDVVKTNALSDFGTMGRAFSATESQLMQRHVEKGYELFTRRVAEGRNMPQDDVKAIAEGRVWTGEQALAIGLVDQLGDLADAIASAAKHAELEKYSIGRYPAPAPWYQSLLNNQKEGYLESEMRNLLGEYYTTFSLIHTLSQQDPIQARIPFDPNIR